jgi:hypothetical protein
LADLKKTELLVLVQEDILRDLVRILISMNLIRHGAMRKLRK